MNYSEEKNQILKGLAASPVVRPILDDFTASLLEEMDNDKTVNVIWADGSNTSVKDSIISFSITNWGREFLSKGGY